MNLDWSPVPIIPKFVDIVVNGIAERTYDIKAYSIDDTSTQKRTKYVEDMMSDMYARDFKSRIQEALGINTFKTDPTDDQLFYKRKQHGSTV